MEVHEHPVLGGKIGEIKARIDHRDFRGLGRFLDRHVNYAQWEAGRVELLGAKGSKGWDGLTSRQMTKYSHISKWWFAWAYFINVYVMKRGFLDGATGFHYAFYKAWYFHSIRLMIKQSSQEKSGT